MTDEEKPRVETGESTRRSFMKASAAGVASAALATSGVGTVAAQDDGAVGEGWKALTFTHNFYPRARFNIVSGVIEWTPNFGAIQNNWFSNYATRQIRWLNTGEVVPLFVAQDAPIGEFDEELGFVADADDDANQPQLYEMDREWTPFDDSSRFLTVNVSTVPEEEEDNILENEDWWQDAGAEAGDTTTTTSGN